MSLRLKRGEEGFIKTLKGQGIGPLTIDDFLGGGVRLIQLEQGYRAGMDAVLLAASIPAGEGEKALDIGAGTGGVAICLAKRCQGVQVHGLEIQPELAVLARENANLNGFSDRIEIFTGSVLENPVETPENYYHHVFANPPYIEGGTGQTSPSKTKELAHFGGLEAWVKFALSRVKNKGTLTFIFRADRLDELLSALHRRAGETVIFPLWPRQGFPAKRVIVQARKGLHGTATLAPGLPLHGREERYSRAAEAILRDGAAIDLTCYHRAKGPGGF